MLLNLGVIVLVIRFVRGVSRTPQARSSIPGVEVVALCIWEEKRCCICSSNVLISSDIILLIMSSTFIVPCGIGTAVGAATSGVERRVGVIRLLASDPDVVCLCWARHSFTAGVFSGVNRGCIGAIRL